MITVGNSTDSFVQLITVLIIFVLVLALTLFTTRWIAKYQKGQKAGSNIDIVETCAVGNGKYIQIVRLAETYVAILVCKESATLLAEIPKEQIEFPTEHGKTAISFKELLRKAKAGYLGGEDIKKDDVSKEE